MRLVAAVLLAGLLFLATFLACFLALVVLAPRV
jgi:hypothetical protein